MNELDFVGRIGKQGGFIKREESIAEALKVEKGPLRVSSDGLGFGEGEPGGLLGAPHGNLH